MTGRLRVRLRVRVRLRLRVRVRQRSVIHIAGAKIQDGRQNGQHRETKNNR
jgi:hypothetical protein